MLEKAERLIEHSHQRLERAEPECLTKPRERAKNQSQSQSREPEPEQEPRVRARAKSERTIATEPKCLIEA